MLNLVCAGRLAQDKGVHTAIEALAKLVHERQVGQVHLTIIGSGRPDYEAYLRELVVFKAVADHVTFLGPVPREEMPARLCQFDVLVFPSIYEEPLARMTQEAMLAGLVVVGTTTGGTKEILVEGKNGLTFAPGDADGLARQLERLIVEPDLRYRLAEVGRQTVLDHFTLDRMVDEIETYLCQVVKVS
jgi:glycosyltransferase involved in cell wall biosynthesis